MRRDWLLFFSRSTASECPVADSEETKAACSSLIRS